MPKRISEPGLSFTLRQITREKEPQTRFCSCDLDLDPMTSIYDIYLDILKMYLRAKNELSSSRLSKVSALQTHRQTDTEAIEKN